MDEEVEQHRKRLHRYEKPGYARFLTFSCFQRKPLLGSPETRDCFVLALERARQTYQFRLVAWVVMPEHVHLILLPKLPEWPVAKILWGLKRGSASKIKRMLETGATADPKGSRALGVHPKACSKTPFHLWQAGGGYDRNIRDMDELREKVLYVHRNPAKRGLVARENDWLWSSARWYNGFRDGPVQTDGMG